MIVKTDAIVLRGRNLRETSRFLTLYTRAFGKIEVVAKGVRQPKSKFRGVLEPFNELSAVLYRKENRGVHYLSDAELTNARHGFPVDYEKLSAAFAIAELTDAVMHHEEANPRMYELLQSALDELDRTGHSSATVLLEFQFHLIRVLGFDIPLDACTTCGNSIDPSRDVWFSPTHGGVWCSGCGRTGGDGTKISSGAYILLSAMTGEGLNSLPSESLAQHAVLELRGLLNAYILHHTESRAVLKSWKLETGSRK